MFWTASVRWKRQTALCSRWVSLVTWLACLVASTSLPIQLYILCYRLRLYLQLHVMPDVHISFSESVLRVFFGRLLSPWPSDADCGASTPVLSSLRISACSSQFRFTFTFATCCRPSVCCLSVCRLSVCNVRAPYSGGSNFRQYLYGIRYIGHPLTSTENFMEIVQG